MSDLQSGDIQIAATFRGSVPGTQWNRNQKSTEPKGIVTESPAEEMTCSLVKVDEERAHKVTYEMYQIYLEDGDQSNEENM